MSYVLVYAVYAVIKNSILWISFSNSPSAILENSRKKCTFELRSKILTLGFSQINLENHSLIRTFAAQ